MTTKGVCHCDDISPLAAVAALSASEIGDLAKKLVNAQFSQAQESAADDYAFDLLTAAGMRRDGLVTAFEKLAKLGDYSSLLSSHPASSERAQHIRDRLAAEKTAGKPVRP
ncbi:MAG: M48 family metalloprotease [Azonexus sp.]